MKSCPESFPQLSVLGQAGGGGGHCCFLLFASAAPLCLNLPSAGVKIKEEKHRVDTLI